MDAIIILSIIFLAGIVSAYQDRCTKSSQFEGSLLSQYSWRIFHPDQSWRNKHKRGSFWTPLADGFHYFKTVQLILWSVSLVITPWIHPEIQKIWELIVWMFGVYAIYIIAHNLFYHQIITGSWGKLSRIIHSITAWFLIWPFVWIHKKLF